jgi:phosphoribosylformimino-5-aminoimidazole carboxamide ribotide isomerase
MIISSISRITSRMDIIPVIDLKGGQVVRARMGQRDQYRPIETPLSPTSGPVDVTRGLLSVFPFHTLYVADLDAIERTGNSDAVLARLSAAFPELTFWVDNGIADAVAAQSFLSSTQTHLVIGSEAQHDDSLAANLKNNGRVILSLDFRGDTFIGPPSLLKKTDIWPNRIIVMTLARVGSDAGPDLERLAEIRNRAGERFIYAAGGVRDRDDLTKLKKDGIAGALVASALHDGRLAAAAIRNL